MLRKEQIAATIAGLGALAQCDYDVSSLTTYKVGGRAAIFVRAETMQDLLLVARVVCETGVPLISLGRGSNLLLSDNGFSGLIVQLGEVAQQILIPNRELHDEALIARKDECCVTAGSAVALPVLARRTATAGIRGFEWAVGVPGSIGGAIRMNAGGHGSDISESLVSAQVLDVRTAIISTVSRAEFGLRFRASDIRDEQLILSATLSLTYGSSQESQQMIDEIVRWRRENQPGGQNAGSVFVNPVPGEIAAGQLIDRCGLRGFRIGSAEVSMKHANFIQVDAGGSAQDVVALMRYIQRAVRDTSGYELRSEIRLIGFGEESQ
ncbi:MAG: UDP-N-acetylmuramate dehydrogenase [Actinomycetes bacterium]